MKDSNFLIIPGFLRTKLNLKGSDLLITALVLGFSQDGKNWFNGNLDYISEWVGIDKSNVVRRLKHLVEIGILLKKEQLVSNVAKMCFYKFNYKLMELVDHDVDVNYGAQNAHRPGAQNAHRPGAQNAHRPGAQNAHDNNIDNNIIDNIDNNYVDRKEILSTDNAPKVNDKLTLFQNSEVYKLVKFDENNEGDYSEFERKFQNPEFEQVDLVYYFHVVNDWSLQKNVKRTKNGWLATIRNFIRRDVDGKKLHLKPQFKASDDTFDINAAMDYLKL